MFYGLVVKGGGVEERGGGSLRGDGKVCLIDLKDSRKVVKTTIISRVLDQTKTLLKL